MWLLCSEELQRDVPCRKKQNARRAPRFPVIYHISLCSLLFIMFLYSHFLYVFTLCPIAASIGLKAVQETSKSENVHGDWGKANNPKVLSASSTTVCKLIFYTVSGEKYFICLFAYLFGCLFHVPNNNDNVFNPFLTYEIATCMSLHFIIFE